MGEILFINETIVTHKSALTTYSETVSRSVESCGKKFLKMNHYFVMYGRAYLLKMAIFFWYLQILENRTKASRNEIETIDALEELRDINTKKAAVDHEKMIQMHLEYEKQLQRLQDEEEEKEIRLEGGIDRVAFVLFPVRCYKNQLKLSSYWNFLQCQSFIWMVMFKLDLSFYCEFFSLYNFF